MMPSESAAARRAIVATSIGNTLEWYDFAVYAQFAGYIAINFFPGEDASARLLKAFLAFGAGFLIRPVGALVIGNLADRAGRKAALTLTIALMAVGTALIALAPSYAVAGVTAPIVLVLGRLLQGFSAGGEVGGAAALLLESAEAGSRGRIAAWLQATMGISNILGALVAFAVTAALSPAMVAAWGWRIPFALGLLIIPVGVYLRRALPEPALQPSYASGSRPAPWLDLFKHEGRTVWVAFCVAVMWAVSVYVLVIYLPTYVQRPDTFGFAAPQAFGASLVGNVPLVVGCIGFGRISDRFGRRALLTVSALLLLTLPLPLLLWLHASPRPLTLVAVQASLCLLVSSIGGVAPAAVAEAFPPQVRSTGTAVVYNAAFTVFGGFAPAILTWFTQRPGGFRYAPAWYVMMSAAVALLAIPFLRSARS